MKERASEENGQQRATTRRKLQRDPATFPSCLSFDALLRSLLLFVCLSLCVWVHHRSVQLSSVLLLGPVADPASGPVARTLGTDTGTHSFSLFETLQCALVPRDCISINRIHRIAGTCSKMCVPVTTSAQMLQTQSTEQAVHSYKLINMFPLLLG